MVVYVRNVDGESYQGRHLLPIVIGANPATGTGIRTGKVQGHVKAPNTKDRYQFVGDRQKGLYKTGLLEQIDNPFIGLTPEQLRGRYALPNSWTVERLTEIAASATISKQMCYEILAGVEWDFYTSKMRKELLASPLVGDGENRTFIETFYVDLFSGTNTFSTDTNRGRMVIQLIKNHPNVAPSLEDVNISVHYWVIVQENEEVMAVVSQNRLENNAIALFNKFTEKHTDFVLYQLAVILRLVKGPTSREVVESKINSFIKEKGVDKQERAQTFLTNGQLYFDAIDRFTVKYYVAQAMNCGVLYTGSGSIFWGHYKDRPERYTWTSEEALITFLIDEHKKFDPKDKNSDNGFFQMMTLLVTRGIMVK